ncbi:MAG: phosphoribosylanthranilate isomerase [Saprospiraceae bacterium]
MKIKICGMKYPENIVEISALQPDFMGFIFYSPSKRYVGDNFPECSINNIPDNIKKTGVFVNESVENIMAMQKRFNFNTIQLHGSETPEYCQNLREQIPIIKVFSVDDHFNFSDLTQFQHYCQYFLFDTKTENYGGSGKSFDWALLDKYILDTPFFLSGGLGSKNIEAALQIKHPMFYGVDLNSKLETSPGIKDKEECKRIIELIRHHEHI